MNCYMWQKNGRSLGPGKVKCHGTKCLCLRLDFLMVCAVETSGAEGCAQGHAEHGLKLYLTRVILLEGHRRHQWGVLGNSGCAPMSHQAIVLHLLVNEEAISSCEHSAALWEETLQRGACPMAWNCQNFETNVIHPLKSTNAVTAQRTCPIFPVFLCIWVSFSRFSKLGIERVNFWKQCVCNKYVQTFFLVPTCWNVVKGCRTFILPAVLVS